jgi:GTPase Era involved in 16S rRNA processing
MKEGKMQETLTKEFETFKEKIKNLALNLKKEDLISEEDFQNLINKLNKEDLVISIIGQMKYGKSTFLNAFLFGQPLLPTSDVPMTAALTAITYGENPKIEIEFYSPQEWEALEKQLEVLKQQKVENEEVKALEETINAARENLGSSIYNYLGTKKEIPLNLGSIEELRNALEDYVGAEGKFTPIVKMTTIYLNDERLKSLKVVDTPGFNDPIESRNKRALDFIKNSDVVILFLYAQRPFDKVDKELIIKKLGFTGSLGKVIVVLNKVDLLLSEHGTLENVKKFVEQQYKKAILEDEKLRNSHIGNILLNAPIIPISSLMALLGRIPKHLLEKDEDLSWYYEQFLEELPFLKSQKDLEEFSQIKVLEEEIKKTIKEEKIRILKDKIKTEILRLLKEQKISLEERKADLEADQFWLKVSEELGNLKKLEKIFKYLEEEKIPEILTQAFEEEYTNLTKKLKIKFGKIINSIQEKRTKCLDSLCYQKGRFGKFNKGEWKRNFEKNLALEYSDFVYNEILPEFKDIDELYFNTLKNIMTFIKFTWDNEIKREIKKIFRNRDEEDTFFGFRYSYIQAILSEASDKLHFNLEEDLKESAKISVHLDIDTAWWFFGSSEDEAYEKAEKAIIEVFDKLETTVDNIFKQLKFIASKYFNPYNKENEIYNKIRERIYQPIENKIK